MRSFINNNQSAFIWFCVVVFLIILYFFFKALPIKGKKAEQKKSQEKKTEEPVKIDIKEPEDVEEKTSDEQTKKDKKSDKKPKIVQVFKREQKSESGETKQKSYDPIYDRNVEFINTSKNIAKFKSFSDETKKEEHEESKNIDEFGFVQDVQEDCEFCDVPTKHFDHSRRLSKAVKEDNFDNMFDSHLSEKYMDINSDRHLKLDEKFNSNLFGRTEEMMSNSLGKLNLKPENENETSETKYSLFSQSGAGDSEKFIDEDEVKVNMKTALIAETYFGKRRKK